MKQRVPQELHLPLQVLWFYQDEIIIIMACYALAMVVGGWAWFILLFGPAIYIRIKRKHARGYLSHVMLSSGFVKLEGYPSFFINNFHE